MHTFVCIKNLVHTFSETIIEIAFVQFLSRLLVAWSPADPGDRGGRPSCARPRTDAPRSGFAGTRHPPTREQEETVARPRSASPLRDRTLPDIARQTQPLEPILSPKLQSVSPTSLTYIV